MNNKAISAILVVLMLLYTVSAIIPPVFAQNNTIEISCKEDFKEFAKNCTLDTWSEGKNVSLTCDIDFSDYDFVPVPTFGGIFNGNGHTISGVNILKNGSYAGLFRYIQKSGKVTNLNVKASITPGGSKSFIGGIAGENSGVIELCTFEGTVKGENVIGGIAGNNAQSGQIISCTSSGSIIGENSTGGISGKNEGLILNCINNMAVNTIYEEKKKDISDFDADVGATIESYKTDMEENEEESVLGHSDTGGIVGYTFGIVQGCINNADVGYKHIGYNVGGIAGRQSGFLLGCQNFGYIQGRKDVGGISGQAEPYILLDVREGSLKAIQEELNKLHRDVNRLIVDADSLGDDTEKYLKNISEQSKKAKDSTKILADIGTDFADDNLGEINAQAAILSNTFDKLTPVFDSLENGCDNLASALDKASAVLKNIDIKDIDLKNETEKTGTALEEIKKAELNIKNASSRLRRAIDNLDDAVKFHNETQARKSLSDLGWAIRDIITAKQNIGNALETIEAVLSEKPESFESIGVNTKTVIENLKIITENINITVSSLEKISKIIDDLSLNVEVEFAEFQDAANNMSHVISYLRSAMSHITNGLEGLGTAMEGAFGKLDVYADDLGEQLTEAKDGLAEAIDLLSYAADDIETSIGDINEIIADLASEKPLEFTKLGDDFRKASDDLFDSIGNISGEIDGLKDTFSDGKDKISYNLTEISNRFNLVMNLMIGEIDELKGTGDGISDIFLDVSDEDIENTKQGKIAECHNCGNVSADRNTGGIAGSMSIEYSKDPEDDFEKPDAFRFTYQTKAILQACINEGEITGKKDCVGGIAGLAEIGTVYDCENYGDTMSKDGSYVGGIAGKSESAVRKSYAKSKVTGKRYAGGIAGKANIITACYTIVNVSGDENIGSVCGDAVSRENLYQNFFVNNGIGAVDSVSYKDLAEPVSFEELKNISSIPVKFISFTVTFTADDKIVETQEIKYGDDTARIKYPKIPEKKGYFGNWQYPKTETVTENINIICEYEPYITVLASNEKNENGKLAVALAEGEFNDKAELRVTESSEKPPVRKDDNVKVYDISLFNTDVKSTDFVTLHLLNENKDNVTAWRLNNGEWEQIKPSERGKYVILKTVGSDSVICLQYTKKSFNLLGLILLLLLTAVIVFIIKFKIKKPKKQLEPAKI